MVPIHPYLLVTNRHFQPSIQYYEWNSQTNEYVTTSDIDYIEALNIQKLDPKQTYYEKIWVQETEEYVYVQFTGDSPFIITEDETPNSEKTYYELTENNYVPYDPQPVDTFDIEKQYYERLQLYVYSSADLTKKYYYIGEVTIDGIVSIILLGNYGDILIGINTNNTESAFHRARGITISEFDETLNYPVKAFLGDLSNLDKEFTLLPDGAGYGLYTENAFLNGSLTTRIRRRDMPTLISYAGVNTLNGANATIFNNRTGVIPDNSSIVFWAGSNGTENSDIQQSPFQVTENGSLYASQGVFEGAIITRSEIRGADIYAARIHGTGREESSQNNYGLAFYNMTNGIVFKTGDDDATATDVFRIGQYGLLLLNNSEQKYFIRINSGNIYFNGFYFVSEGESTNFDAGVLRHDGLYWHPDKSNLSLIDNPVYYNLKFAIESNEIIASFRQGEQKAFEINYTNGTVSNNLDLMYISKTLNLGEKLEYRQVSNGYDLYVS